MPWANYLAEEINPTLGKRFPIVRTAVSDGIDSIIVNGKTQAFTCNGYQAGNARF